MKRKIIFGVLLGVPLTLIIAALLAGTLLSSPANQTIGPPPSDLPIRPVQFSSASGTTIHGWLINGRPKAGVVVLMHGVRSNRLSMVDRARFLSDAGYSVLLFDFQAHGESVGEVVTFGSLESKDAQAAIRFLRENVPGEKIGIIGVSMGGAATILSEPTIQAEAVVLEMVYPTIEEAVRNRITRRLGGWAKVLSPLLLIQLQPRLGVDGTRLRPIDLVNQIEAPKLFIAGANDRHTTLEESRRLYETAKAPKDFWVVPGADHIDVHGIAKVEYEHRVLEFFAKYLR